mgnify:FL=1
MSGILTVDQVRSRFAGLDSYETLPMHSANHTTFMRNDAGRVVMRTTPDGADAPTEVVVSEEFWSAVCKDLGAGERFLTRMPPAVAMEGVNWWYANPDSGKKPVLAVVRNGVGDNIVKNLNAQPIAAERLLDLTDQVFSNGGDRPTYRAAWVSGSEYATYSAVLPTAAFEVQDGTQVGDVLHAGVTVQFSPIGRGPLSVTAYVDRLVCTNGMVLPTAVNTWKTSGDGPVDPYEWFPEVLPQALAAAQESFQGIQQLARTEVPESHIGSVTDDLFTQMRVPGNMQRAVVDRLAEVNVRTLYDVFNAMTYVATHDERFAHDPQARIRLMARAGAVPGHTERCESCLHLLS